MPRCRLITIKFSHYNEAARWALDLQRVPYTESRHAPGLHVPAVWLATRGRGTADKASSKLSTPCLKAPEGSVVQGSLEILRYADAHRERGFEPLVPVAERDNEWAWELMSHYHDRLGPNTRRWIYGFVLSDAELFTRLARLNSPAWQSWLISKGSHGLISYIRSALAVTPERVERSLEHVRAEVDAASHILRSSHFLGGDLFTAVDLYFACMLAPALLVQPHEGYDAVLPRIEDAPEDVQEVVHELRATPAGKHALRMFADFRKPPHAQDAAALHAEHPL